MAYPAPERSSGAANAMERTTGLVSPGNGCATSSASPHERQRDAIDSVDCPCRRRLGGPELQGERQNAGGKQ